MDNTEDKPLNIEGLIGIGLDGEPDQKRLTRGPQFVLFGGSRETHEHMTEFAVRFTEKVDALGKPIQQVNERELRRITRELREEVG